MAFCYTLMKDHTVGILLFLREFWNKWGNPQALQSDITVDEI